MFTRRWSITCVGSTSLNSGNVGDQRIATANGIHDLRSRLDAADIDYSYTVKADPRFLDWANGDAARCNPVVEAGSLLHLRRLGQSRNGRQYAAILDNNYPGRFELTPREQFVRLWAGYGGFALTVMEDPASSLPYRSYEVIDER